MKGRVSCTKCGATATLESMESEWPMCWAHGGGEPNDTDLNMVMNDSQRAALEEDASLLLDEELEELDGIDDFDDDDMPEDDVDNWNDPELNDLQRQALEEDASLLLDEDDFELDHENDDIDFPHDDIDT